MWTRCKGAEILARRSGALPLVEGPLSLARRPVKALDRDLDMVLVMFVWM